MNTAVIWVDLGGDTAPPARIGKLAARADIKEIITVTLGSYSPGQYWSQIIAAIPDQVDQALVISGASKVPKEMLRLRPLLTERVAAVFPLGMVHAHAHTLMNSQASLNLSVRDMNVWLNRYAVGKPIEIPTMAGLCAWVDARLLRACAAESDQSLEQALRARGLSIILSDQAFVDDSSDAPYIDDSRYLPSDIAQAMALRHPYTKLRHPLWELNARSEAPPDHLAEGPEAILHISHSWGGGLERWIQDFTQSDTRHLSLTLKSVGNKDMAAHSLGLYLKGRPEPLKQWSLSTPILSAAVGHEEYRQVIEEIREAFSVRAVVVSTLIGHSLDLYRLGLPVVQVLHDFFPWCPPLYAFFDEACTSCDSDRLQVCLKKNSAHEFFREEPAQYFLEFRQHLLKVFASEHVQLVAPSESVKTRWCQLAPALEPSAIEVIGHGLPKWKLKAFRKRRWTPEEGKRQHIVVLGSLAPHKGGEMLTKVLKDILKEFDVTLLGCGDSITKLPKHDGLTLQRWYQLHDLPKLLGKLQPDFGLLLSVVPETFSYTLSELWAAGVPPIATALGAFSDRIESGKNGWLIEPKAKALLEQLQLLSNTPQEVQRVKAQVEAQRLESAREVTKRYLRLLPPLTHDVRSRSLAKSVLATPSGALGSHEPIPAALVIAANSPYRIGLLQFLDYTLARLQQVQGLKRLLVPILRLPIRVMRRLVRP